MSQSKEEREKSMASANDTSNYTLLLVGVLIGIVGVYARFAYDSVTLSIVSWVILLIGTIIACKGVFKMMGTK